MSKYDELKRLAEAATQGDWTHWKHGVVKGGPVVQFSNGSGQQQIVMTTGAEWMRAGEQYANADFIAAANPAAVLALIAENERLERLALDSVNAEHAANMDLESICAERDQLRAEIAGLKTGYEAYERVNAELKAEMEALRKGWYLNECGDNKFWPEEMEELKAESEELRKAITDIYDALYREYWSEYAGLDETRAILDAALGRGEKS